ncbi:MAG: hypothetical protein ACLPKI_10845 [Streptosporangiaceae bacterium]
MLITLLAVFLLLDAMFGFTKHHVINSAQLQAAARGVSSSNLSTSCRGGFSNQRTVGGVTQIAPHGTPFNAYQVTLTNIGNRVITIDELTVELRDYKDNVFAQQHDADLGDGSGITLGLGQSRTILETTGISQPVASCDVLGW